MKGIVRIGIIVALFLAITAFTTKEQTFSIKVNVSGLRNNSGNIQFALYNKDGTVPDEKYKKYYKIQVGEISNNSATITFNNLPEGTYAVNILHDENKDGKIDKGWVLPIEGIGFSNITKIGLRNRPNFKKASFDLNSDKTIGVKIIYM